MLSRQSLFVQKARRREYEFFINLTFPLSAQQRLTFHVQANPLNHELTKLWPKPPVPGNDVVGRVKKRQRTGEMAQSDSEGAGPRISKKKERPPPTDVSICDFGGFEMIGKEVSINIIDWFTCRFHRMSPASGILIHGPSGCGKTMLIKAIAALLEARFIHVSATSLVSGVTGNTEKKIREIIDEALEIAPCVIFFENPDAIMGRAENTMREMERRIVGEMCASLDRLKTEGDVSKPVLVLAEVKRPENLDPSLRTAMRFEKEISLPIPNIRVREEILRKLAARSFVADDISFLEVARKTPGFTGGDLRDLMSAAALIAQQRCIDACQREFLERRGVKPSGDLSHMDRVLLRQEMVRHNAIPQPDSWSYEITTDDLVRAIPSVQPAAKREGFSVVPDTTWKDVGAMEDVRKVLESEITSKIANMERRERQGLQVKGGVLLWGPPGCGKTLVAKAVANDANANFISVKGAELLNMYVGESEKAIRNLFARARASMPCIIFFDEFDALAPIRANDTNGLTTRVVNALLAELDGVASSAGIFVVAATNRADLIDPALLRPGRIPEKVFVGLPDPEARAAILETVLRTKPKDPHTEEAVHIAREFARNRCVGFSGADIWHLWEKAANMTVARGEHDITLADWEAALETVKRSVSEEAAAMFETMRPGVGQIGHPN